MGRGLASRRTAIAAPCTWLVLVFVLLSSCGRSGQEKASADQANQGSAPPSPTIVSLTPAITQMLIDMGKRDQIVGVSRDDDRALGLPVCGSYNDPVLARILELEPDLVITETPFGDYANAPGLLRTHAEQGIFKLAVIPHSRSIADVERALTDAEIGLGQVVGDRAAAERARNLMMTRLERIREAVEDAGRPRVLMLIEPASLGALGPGATHDELLRLAGGTNAVAEYKSAYIRLDRAQIQQAVRPDIVLIIEPDGQAIEASDPRLRALEGLVVPAVADQRFFVIGHPQALLPSTQIPAIAKQMAIAIHPAHADAIEAAYASAERDLLEHVASTGGDGP